MAILTEVGLRELLRHLGRWLTNLKRAGSERQQQSIASLRAVVIAARHTKAYVRQLRDTARQDHREEARLSTMWTELSFRLTDLKLTKLAKRCDIRGRYWADPSQFDDDFLAKADIGLERMEQLARQLIAKIESSR
jgi:Sec-independent protein translocase protein TatA